MSATTRPPASSSHRVRVLKKRSAIVDHGAVTPEMIEAGARILELVFDAPTRTARSFAEEIFMAMESVRSGQHE